MTSRTGNSGIARVEREANRRRAFTLIELILVMAMLAIVMAMASPTLSRFFRGRALVTEAGRVLALTRYGQNTAVTTGRPMILWVNQREGTYGLREERSFVAADLPYVEEGETLTCVSEERRLDFKLARDLRFELPASQRTTNGLVAIRFAPDGSLEESGPRYLLIMDRDDQAQVLVPSRNRLRYEMVDPTNQWYLERR